MIIGFQNLQNSYLPTPDIWTAFLFAFPKWHLYKTTC